MDLDSVEAWRWIWLGATVLFVVGEIAIAGSFFLAPFAVGAGAATVAAFLGATVSISWLLFVAVSAATSLLLRPLARRLDRDAPAVPAGAGRWVGREAVVLEDIPADSSGAGLVRLDREEWRAESLDGGPVAAGERVVIVQVNGTRLVVRRSDPV